MRPHDRPRDAAGLRRRTVLAAAAATAASAATTAATAATATAATATGRLAAAPPPAGAEAAPAGILTRPVPSTGERIPALGLGTWLTFDVDPGDAAALARRRQVLDTFLAGGGRLVDSSPMYGRAERVMGALLRGAAPGTPAAQVVLATKVWTPLESNGPAQMRRSLELWGRPRADLMQVHNFLAWRGHLATLRSWQREGRVRLVGVTTSHGRDHELAAEVLRSETLDSLQLTYSPADRRAEPLLELAAARGVAVVVNRPFDGGALLERLSRVPLPQPLARELGCSAWAGLVLKWELAHPAVTCAIPATTNPAHQAQNNEALRGPLPDAAQRAALLRAMAPALG